MLARYALATAGVALPLFALSLTGAREVQPSPLAHFWPVLLTAGTAAIVAAGVTVAGVRARDGRAILLGTAFSTTTALLAVHGMATPGVLTGPNGVIALAGGASLPVGTALLAMTALPGLRRPRRIAPLLVLQAVLALAVVGLAALALAVPSLIPAVPKAGSPPAVALLVFGVACLAMLGHRALRTHALTHRPTDLLVVTGCGWLLISLFTQLGVGPGSVAFYGGHALELGGIALIGIPTVLDLMRGGASRPLVGDLGATDLVAAEEAYLGTRVRALIVRLAERDASTEEHTRRVALLAARVGEEMRLPASSRRDTGYPRGLCGPDLPVETRILAVCDVYDALVSDRVYRTAWRPERALALLHDEDTAYDPPVVAALERVVAPAGSPSWIAGLTGSTHGPPVVRPSWTVHP